MFQEGMTKRSNHSATDFWSIKFYPYTEPGVDPIFAIVGGKHVSFSFFPAETLQMLTWFRYWCAALQQEKKPRVLKSFDSG